MGECEYKYLRFIPYRNFVLWDVKRYNKIKTSFSNGVLLKDILTPYVQPLSKKDMISNNWQIISKINFGGQLFLRDIQELNTFKGSLYKVDEDILIYSKINVRHGCVYYHPKGSTPFGVSTEYPAYRIDDNKAIGTFIVKVIQSDTFKTLLSQRSTGISKSRVKSIDFLDTEIPLPSLLEQQNILSEYDVKIKQAESIEKESQQIGKDIEVYITTALGTSETSHNIIYHKEHKYLSYIKFKDLSIWGPDLLFNGQKQTYYKYRVLKVSEMCSIGSGGTPSRGNKDYFGGNIPWIKTGELNNTVLMDTEEKLTLLGLNNSSAKLYPKGSLVIAMYGATIGKTAKLGIDAATNQACAVLYNIDSKQVHTDYMWFYLQSQSENLKAMAYGGAQPNINAGIIADYNIPLPPLNVQKEIADYMRKQMELVTKLKIQAQAIREKAIIDFEKAIFK